MLFVANLMNELDKRVICSKYCHFVTEEDNLDDESEKELEIEYSEDYFDPEDNVFQNSYLDDENVQENGMCYLFFSIINVKLCLNT